MTLTDRDKKIALILIPVLVLAGYWFLILSPKRAESAKLGDELAQAEVARDDAVSRASSVSTAKTDFAAGFAEVLRVGKAIPTDVDMPALLLQLEHAAKGTGIGFNSIKAGQRTTTQPAPPVAAGGSAPPVAAGGESASTGAGQAAESANDASATSDDKNAALGADQPGAAAGGTAPGLDSVPLDFTFTGDFFELADFFHQLKRFVHLKHNRIVVDGRLMVVQSFSLKMKAFPTLEATMTANVYLSPEAEGATAGATPQGPATATTPAAAPAPAPAAPSAAPTPAAVPSQ